METAFPRSPLSHGLVKVAILFAFSPALFDYGSYLAGDRRTWSSLAFPILFLITSSIREKRSIESNWLAWGLAVAVGFELFGALLHVR